MVVPFWDMYDMCEMNDDLNVSSDGSRMVNALHAENLGA